jgi:DNA-binding MarR family transcriptional regulator
MQTKIQQDLRPAMAAFFHAYMAFTDKPDEILAKRGLARVHHRILFFIACQPSLSVKELLALLGVSKQAINTPMRQLIEMGLMTTETDPVDRRVKRLGLTETGNRLEQELHLQQVQLLEQAFARTGLTAAQNWLRVNQELAKKEGG